MREKYGSYNSSPRKKYFLKFQKELIQKIKNYKWKGIFKYIGTSQNEREKMYQNAKCYNKTEVRNERLMMKACQVPIVQRVINKI